MNDKHIYEYIHIICVIQGWAPVLTKAGVSGSEGPCMLMLIYDSHSPATERWTGLGRKLWRLQLCPMLRPTLRNLRVNVANWRHGTTWSSQIQYWLIISSQQWNNFQWPQFKWTTHTCSEVIVLHVYPLSLQAAMARGSEETTLVELTQGLVAAVSSYKSAAATVKSLMPKAKSKAKAKAKGSAAPSKWLGCWPCTWQPWVLFKWMWRDVVLRFRAGPVHITVLVGTWDEASWKHISI